MESNMVFVCRSCEPPQYFNLRGELNRHTKEYHRATVVQKQPETMFFKNSGRGGRQRQPKSIQSAADRVGLPSVEFVSYVADSIAIGVERGVKAVCTALLEANVITPRPGQKRKREASPVVEPLVQESATQTDEIAIETDDDVISVPVERVTKRIREQGPSPSIASTSRPVRKNESKTKTGALEERVLKAMGLFDETAGALRFNTDEDAD